MPLGSREDINSKSNGNFRLYNEIDCWRTRSFQYNEEYDDVMTWTRICHYWLVVWGNPPVKGNAEFWTIYLLLARSCCWINSPVAGYLCCLKSHMAAILTWFVRRYARTLVKAETKHHLMINVTVMADSRIGIKYFVVNGFNDDYSVIFVVCTVLYNYLCNNLVIVILIAIVFIIIIIITVFMTTVILPIFAVIYKKNAHIL